MKQSVRHDFEKMCNITILRKVALYENAHENKKIEKMERQLCKK